jgi:hypothetical protein
LRRNVAYQVYLGFVDVPVGKMFQQVFESEYAEFLLQQVAPLRAYTFQVFDGTG